MEPKQLKEIEDRVQKMPRWPLVPCSCGNCGVAWNAAGDVPVVSFTGPKDAECPVPQTMTDAYCDFFVHAVDDVPLLVATVRVLQGEVARLKHELWSVTGLPKLKEVLSGKALIKHLADEEKKEMKDKAAA